MRLTDRFPSLDADALVKRMTPPPRFESATFGSYIPDPAQDTQTQALLALEKYATTGLSTPKRRLFKSSPRPVTSSGLYLDGGYGVGKTHLLASLWHAWNGAKAYATFTELTSFIGFSQMGPAVEAFSKFDLICIDEFELDDVANTLMVVSFLRALSQLKPVRMVVTSNTLPDRLGEQRFSAHDFKREIAAIAGYFDELKIGGSDFRTVVGPASALHPLQGRQDDGETEDLFDPLLAHLHKVHPVQYSGFFDGVGSVTINEIHPIDNQDDALLFVQFVDKLYDAQIQASLNGCEVENIFAAEYRSGGYRKKYGRAESRMLAMKTEAASRIPKPTR